MYSECNKTNAETTDDKHLKMDRKKTVGINSTRYSYFNNFIVT